MTKRVIDLTDDGPEVKKQRIVTLRDQVEEEVTRVFPYNRACRKYLLDRFDKPETSIVFLRDDIRMLVSVIWVDLCKKMQAIPDGIDLTSFLDTYDHQAKDTVTITYEVDNYYGPTAEEEETMPSVALRFLDIVNPSISITRSKHDYWESSWSDLNYSQDPADMDIDPEDWEEEGLGYWHDAVDGQNRWAAYNYFIQHEEDEDFEAVKKKTLELWG